MKSPCAAGCLPIGGLKEKLLAALRGGIKKVLIPEDNAKDLAEIPDNVKNNMEIIPVSRMGEVLEHALIRQPEPIEWDGIVRNAGHRSGRRRSMRRVQPSLIEWCLPHLCQIARKTRKKAGGNAGLSLWKTSCRRLIFLDLQGFGFPAGLMKSILRQVTIELFQTI